MKLLDKINENTNFYIKEGYVYNVNREDKLFKIENIIDYNCGTFITYYKTGMKIENKIFGRVEYRFYDNFGNLLDKIKEDNLEKSSQVYMYVLENGILSVSNDFSEFPYYKWTKYNGIRKINYDINKIVELINKDQKNIDNKSLEM